MIITNPKLMLPAVINREECNNSTIENVNLSIGVVLNLEEDAHGFLEKRINVTNASYYAYNRGQEKEQSDNRNVYFYEFSDIYSKPLLFPKISVFVEWATKHNVIVTDYIQTTMRENKVNFVCCYKNSQYVCARDTYEALARTIDWKSYSQENNNNSYLYGGNNFHERYYD